MKTLQQIPILDLGAEVNELWDELNAALQRVLRATQFIMGPEVSELEQKVAHYLGVRHAIALNSGTDALIIGLRALGIGPGDEVITSPFTFFATAEAISLLGAKPVFVDIDPHSFNLNPDLLEAAITTRTRAIVPVHLYGNPAAMTAILELAQRHNLKVLEDCAQSFGARYEGGPGESRHHPDLLHRHTGSLGDAGAYSFFPSKNLGAYGDGGLLVTSNDTIAELARMLRAHGSRKKYYNELIGYNSRLDTLQAAILLVKLPHLERYNQARRAIAERYNQALADTPGLRTPALNPGHVFHQYTVRILNGRRDQVQQRLSELGIGTMVYYPTPLHRLPVYQNQGLHLPESERAAAEVLSLPIWPQMNQETQEVVVEALKKVLNG
ncbi:DegT/DnrJ/EryC1/StrS family aminotransferase [Meiothermus hypogaeus]|uniref:Aminotransferase n=2 Tax=Meiothermus hypogaeus TaxID=884155 RepID=A0A511QZN8_9DEIN|nr:DegT/DnrJ/EryC1/StrS family aminotransferase [Meiothermus hypogaeus]RIH76904.1 UDP-2-acetamido-2-deoxy-3-oxo-D-glucuronate aminotransferase [Meiothermus hypogaeus]GEM82839.1 aminotransferase [Meiothermus hypogaeus NBRC 106114]